MVSNELFQRNKFFRVVFGSSLGLGIGVIMGLNYIAIANRQDRLILGACEGMIVGGLVAANCDKINVTAVFTKRNGVLVIVLMGALLGTLMGTIVSALDTSFRLRLVSTLIGSALGAYVGFSLRSFPERLGNGPKWLWPLFGQLLTATAAATSGLVVGALSGALLGAIGGGLLIAGMFWAAMWAALVGSFIGATVGIVVGATVSIAA